MWSHLGSGKRWAEEVVIRACLSHYWHASETLPGGCLCRALGRAAPWLMFGRVNRTLHCPVGCIVIFICGLK